LGRDDSNLAALLTDTRRLGSLSERPSER